jgi:hypothetical protein
MKLGDLQDGVRGGMIAHIHQDAFKRNGCH